MTSGDDALRKARMHHLWGGRGGRREGARPAHEQGRFFSGDQPAWGGRPGMRMMAEVIL